MKELKPFVNLSYKVSRRGTVIMAGKMFL